ncbi:MAG: hypothetical protein AB7U41_06315 [Dongiaceae bacterium]
MGERDTLPPRPERLKAALKKPRNSALLATAGAVVASFIIGGVFGNLALIGEINLTLLKIAAGALAAFGAVAGVIKTAKWADRQVENFRARIQSEDKITLIKFRIWSTALAAGITAAAAAGYNAYKMAGALLDKMDKTVLPLIEPENSQIATANLSEAEQQNPKLANAATRPVSMLIVKSLKSHGREL